MLDAIGNGLSGFVDGLSDLGSAAWDAAGDAFDGLAALGHTIADTSSRTWDDWFGGGAAALAAHTATPGAGTMAASRTDPVTPWGGYGLLGSGGIAGSGAFALPQGKPLMNFNFLSDKLVEFKKEHVDPFQGMGSGHLFDVYDERSATRWLSRSTDQALHLDFHGKAFPELGRQEISGALGLDLLFDDATLSFKSTGGLSSLDKEATRLLPSLRHEVAYSDPDWFAQGMNLFGSLAHGITTRPNGTSSGALEGALKLDWDSPNFESRLHLDGKVGLDGPDAGTGQLDLEFGTSLALMRKPFEVTAGGLFGLHTDFKGSGNATVLRAGPTLGINISDGEQLNFGFDVLHQMPMLSLSKDF